MKQVTFAGGLLFLGLALGLVIPGVLAQDAQPQVQKWEQFCEPQKFRKSTAASVEAANPRIASHGKNGYQLVSAPSDSGALIFCYRRPAR